MIWRGASQSNYEAEPIEGNWEWQKKEEAKYRLRKIRLKYNLTGDGYENKNPSDHGSVLD